MILIIVIMTFRRPDHRETGLTRGKTTPGLFFSVGPDHRGNGTSFFSRTFRILSVEVRCYISLVDTIVVMYYNANGRE